MSPYISDGTHVLHSCRQEQQKNKSFIAQFFSLIRKQKTHKYRNKDSKNVIRRRCSDQVHGLERKKNGGVKNNEFFNDGSVDKRVKTKNIPSETVSGRSGAVIERTTKNSGNGATKITSHLRTRQQDSSHIAKGDHSNQKKTKTKEEKK